MRDDLISSVRLKLCGGERRRLVLADLFVFCDIMAFYCKERLELRQAVHEHLAQLATLGVSVKLNVAQTRKPQPVVVPLKMGNPSQMRVAVGLALICHMVFIKDSFFLFILGQVKIGKRVPAQNKPAEIEAAKSAAGSAETASTQQMLHRPHHVPPWGPATPLAAGRCPQRRKVLAVVGHPRLQAVL